MKKIFSLAIMAVVMCLMASCGGSDTPGNVAKKCMELTLNGNIKDLDKYLDLENPKTKDAYESLCKLIEFAGTEGLKEEINKKEGIKSIEVVEENIDGENANVKIKITYGNGEESSDDMDLVLKDGKWKAKM